MKMKPVHVHRRSDDDLYRMAWDLFRKRLHGDYQTKTVLRLKKLMHECFEEAKKC